MTTNTKQKTPARRRRQKGRPSLLTPERMDMLVRATAAGLTVNQTADVAGVSRSSFLRWMQAGGDMVEEKGGLLDVHAADPQAALYARVTKARAAAAARAHMSIEEAAHGAIVSETYKTWTDPETGIVRREKKVRRRPADWRAAAYILVRLEPNPKSFDEMLDEEVERMRAESGGPVETAMTAQMQDLAARLQKTLAQYREEAEALEEKEPEPTPGGQA